MNFYQLVDKAPKTYTHWLTESGPIFPTIYISREGRDVNQPISYRE